MPKFGLQSTIWWPRRNESGYVQHWVDLLMMNNAPLLFVITLVVCALVFFGLDFAVMKLNGLSLFYHP